MRAALELLYRGSGLLGGFFLVAIAALTAAQIVGRSLGFAAYSFDDFAGFCLAATSFLGLAWTFREDEHIRMTLAPYPLRDVSQGLVPVALWIPQAAMALGLVVLLLAVIDDLVAALRSRPTSYEAAEARRPAAQAPSFER